MSVSKGMFAFPIFDGGGRSGSRPAIKPFYYTTLNGVLYFASVDARAGVDGDVDLTLEG